jgi:hypothetical protein
MAEPERRGDQQRADGHVADWKEQMRMEVLSAQCEISEEPGLVVQVTEIRRDWTGGQSPVALFAMVRHEVLRFALLTPEPVILRDPTPAGNSSAAEGAGHVMKRLRAMHEQSSSARRLATDGVQEDLETPKPSAREGSSPLFVVLADPIHPSGFATLGTAPRLAGAVGPALDGFSSKASRAVAPKSSLLLRPFEESRLTNAHRFDIKLRRRQRGMHASPVPAPAGCAPPRVPLVPGPVDPT